MSDQIAVMDRSRVVQLGAPRDIYFRPASAFVASFIGGANLLDGTAEEAVAPGATGPVRLAGGERLVCLFPEGADAATARSVAIRPESIMVSATNGGGENTLSGTVTAASFLGGNARYDIAVGAQTLRVVGPAETMLAQGAGVFLAIPPYAAVVVRPAAA